VSALNTGFPIDLTHLIAKENGRTFDMDAVDRLMEEERDKSRAHAFSLSSSSSSAPSSVKLGEGGVPTAIKEWIAEGTHITRALALKHALRQSPHCCSCSCCIPASLGITPEFTGYAREVEEETSVVALLPDPQRRTLWLSISPCPFYGMAGGQVGDRGAYPRLQSCVTPRARASVTAVRCLSWC
jgi:alanyl-tRNA synthetase